MAFTIAWALLGSFCEAWWCELFLQVSLFESQCVLLCQMRCQDPYLSWRRYQTPHLNRKEFTAVFSYYCPSFQEEWSLSTALFRESCHFLVCRERAVGRAPEGLFHLRPSIGLLPTPTVGITSLHCFLLISFSLTLHDAVIPFHCGFSDCWDLDLVRSSAGGRRDYKWPTRDCWDWLVESDDGFQRGHTDGSDRD